MANALGDATAKMAYQDKSNAVRWVDQANFHITLAFLGEQDEQTLERLAEELDETISFASIPLKVTHFSPFPESRPKLIAAMLKATDELKVLQKQVAAAAHHHGVMLEKRRFIPHLTLGRFRHSRNHFAGVIPTSLEELEVEADAQEMILFESILTPNGAEYEPLYRFPLEYADDEYAAMEFD